METRTSYVMVGAFVLSLIAALMVFAVWLTQSGLKQDESQLYHIYFSGSVSGLQAGSVVRYQGISVGTVKKLEIAPNDVEKILVTISIPKKIEIKEDAEASLQLLGVTGGAYVQISGATQEAKRLEGKNGELPVIKSTESSLSSLMEKAPELMDKLIQIADSANKVLSDENVEDLSKFVDNLAVISENLEQASGDFQVTVAHARSSTEKIDRMITDFDEKGQVLADKGIVVLDQATKTLQTIENDVNVVTQEISQTTGNLKKMTDNFALAADQVGKMIQENRQPIRDFTSSGLYEFSFLIVEFRELINSLTRVSGQIERNPTYFLFGKQGTVDPVEAK